MKKRLLGILLIILIILLGVMIYKVNKNIPKDYYEQSYSNKDKVKTEKCEISVNSYDIRVVDSDNIEIDVDYCIKNKGSNLLDITSVCLSNLLCIDMIKSDYSKIKNYEEYFSNVNSGDTVNVKMIYYFYNVSIENIKDNFEIRNYLSKDLYVNEVKDYYSKEKLYTKYIQLGRWKDK